LAILLGMGQGSMDTGEGVRDAADVAGGGFHGGTLENGNGTEILRSGAGMRQGKYSVWQVGGARVGVLCLRLQAE
jgi:hypothetical protein